MIDSACADIRRVVIYGAGSFARMMRHYLDGVKNQRVVAYCVDEEYRNDRSEYDGLPLVSFDALSDAFPVGGHYIMVAVGYSNMRARVVMYNKIKEKGYKCINFIDPSVVVDKTAKMGENNIILNGSLVEPYVNIGNNNIIWGAVNVSHDVRIADHCFITSKALLAGNCVVEDNCFIGLSVTCAPGITIRKESLLAAGSLVLKDTKEYSCYMGSPARMVSSHEDTGIVIS